VLNHTKLGVALNKLRVGACAKVTEGEAERDSVGVDGNFNACCYAKARLDWVRAFRSGGVDVILHGPDGNCAVKICKQRWGHEAKATTISTEDGESVTDRADRSLAKFEDVVGGLNRSGKTTSGDNGLWGNYSVDLGAVTFNVVAAKHTSVWECGRERSNGVLFAVSTGSAAHAVLAGKKSLSNIRDAGELGTCGDARKVSTSGNYDWGLSSLRCRA
jgi:hypothetical protein